MAQIFEACTAAESPKPRIVAEPGGLWLEFPFAREQAAGGAMGGLVGGAIVGAMGGPVGGAIGGAMGGQIGGQMGGQIELTDRQNDLIGLIRADTRLNRKILADQLGINQSAVQKLLEALKKNGVLKRIGGTRGHWEIKI